MSLKDNNKNKKNIQEQIEERVKYFIKFQPQNNNKQKNIKRSPYMDNLQTLIDPINIRNNNVINNFDNNYHLNHNKTQNIENDIKHNKIQNNIMANAPLNIHKKNANDSTISTQTIMNLLDLPIKKSVSIHIDKQFSNCTEPRYQKKKFLKLSPKFSSINENNDSFIKNDDIQSAKHKYTNSELELLEIDEKIPQYKIKEITSNIFDNTDEDILGNYNLLLIFHYLTNIEKFYQELSKDLKGNGSKNMEYKLKIACNYINEICEENNIINDIISEGEKEINIFLIRELCFFLIFLFLDNFKDKLNDNNIRELLTCHNYCHINLLYIIFICIQMIEQQISENKIKIEENSTEYYNYQKCKILIKFNDDKINPNKYKENFHINNKIIKNIFLNIINNLDDKDNSIIKIILEIFNLSKKSQFKTIINDHIKNNSLIKEKMNQINIQYHSPEDNNENDNALSTNSTERIKPPFLPPKKPDDKRDYCLVLDLDETLVHFFEDNNEAYVKVRMGAEKFITVLSHFCEIVIFTASTKNYADIVIDGLDCKNLIDYKLYREHTDEYNGINIKDLSKLGRDLNKIIIIDNIEENYFLQPKNGLNIIDFEGDENDNELDYILEDLLKIVKVPGKNITEELPPIRENMQKRYCNI